MQEMHIDENALLPNEIIDFSYAKICKYIEISY